MSKKGKKEILDTALEIRRCNLISLSEGNVSMKAGESLFLVTPSGMIREEMTTDDVVAIDRECKVMEGIRRPSSDPPALVCMFEHMPHTNALIHTHRPYVTTAKFAANQIPEFLVTLIDASGTVVNVAPFMPSSDTDMGIMAVKYAGGSRAVVLKHHGIMAYGADMEEALYSAVYLEEVTKASVLAKAMGAGILSLALEDIAREKRG